jgi:hypothetical protein
MGSLFSVFLKGVPNLFTMREVGKDRSPGVPKDNKSTIAMALMSIEWMRKKRIYASENLIAGENTTPHDMFEMVVRQASEYELKVETHPDNPFRAPKYTFAGASHDDLLISVMMIIYWHTFFWQSDWTGYAPFKRRILQMRVPTKASTAPSLHYSRTQRVY